MQWIKSSLSSPEKACVEVAPVHDAVAVRDSKDPHGPQLAFDGDAWRTFIADVRTDRPMH